MSYRQIAFSGTILTSEIDFKSILNDIIEADQKNLQNKDESKQGMVKQRFKAIVSQYNFTDDIPKEFLFVKLKSGLP